MNQAPEPNPVLLPLGDSALLVRFGSALSDRANIAAISFAQALAKTPLAGAVEVSPNLVSVLVRFDPAKTDPEQLAGEIRLRLAAEPGPITAPLRQQIGVTFDGADLAEVAGLLDLGIGDFIAAHNAKPLRVLATGFAPGFVYCGFHPEALHLKRRASVRPMVPAGTILFAAGQTAISATPIPTGWHVIGHTAFINLDAARTPPTRLAAGDEVVFTRLGP